MNISTKFEDFYNIISLLRGQNGCPWDKEQDENTIKNYVLEEAQEVFSAIEQGDTENICEELGDLLMQIVFLAQIYSERKSFDMEDIILGIHQKMIRRHPHIFGQTKASNIQEVLENWERIKVEEKKNKKVNKI